MNVISMASWPPPLPPTAIPSQTIPNNRNAQLAAFRKQPDNASQIAIMPLSSSDNSKDTGSIAKETTTAATSTVGNAAGGVGRTAGGVVGSVGSGLGETVNSTLGDTGKPVGNALGSLGTGVQGGTEQVSKGVENAGKGQKPF